MHDRQHLSSRPVRDRRRAARVRMLGELHGQRVGLDVPFTVRDISEGGFAVESGVCFPDGDTQLFELDSAFLGSRIVVAARAVRSEPAPDGRHFVTGFEFALHQPQARRDAITAWGSALVSAVERTSARPATASGAERRELPRLDVIGQMYGEILELGIPFVVRDVSAGGLSIESHVQLTLDETHRVRLDLVDDVSVTVHVRVAHVHDVSRAPRQPRFHVGFAFVHDNIESRQAIGIVLDQITAALSFD